MARRSVRWEKGPPDLFLSAPFGALFHLTPSSAIAYCLKYLMQLDKDSGNIDILMDYNTRKTVRLRVDSRLAEKIELLMERNPTKFFDIFIIWCYYDYTKSATDSRLVQVNLVDKNCRIVYRTGAAIFVSCGFRW